MNDHEWFRSRAAARMLGVLPEEEDARFLEHASECQRCGALLTRLERDGEDWWDGTEHPSVSTLVALGRRPEVIAPADRRWIDKHLASCHSCREDLEELRDPVAGQISPGMPPQVGSPSWRRNLPAWLFGGVIGSLATAAVLLLVARVPLGRGPATIAEPPVTATSPSSVAPPPSPMPSSSIEPVTRPTRAPLRSMAAVQWLKGVTRAGGVETTLVRVAKGSLVPVRTPLIREPAARVRVSLLDPSGEVVSRQSTTGKALIRSGTILDTADLPEGVYLLVLDWMETSGVPAHREYAIAFKLEH